MADKKIADPDLIDEFQRRFRLAESADATNRETYAKDRKFVYSDEAQWDGSADRGQRPKVTINKLQVTVRNIVNEAREAPVAIKTHPVDEFGDVQLARVIDGLIRHVEHDSNASDVYNAAFEDAVTGGFGYVRIVTDYESEDSFNQCPKIKRVINPLSVYMDPFHELPDASDALWCIIHTRISRSEFERLYPDADPFTSSRTDNQFWVSDAGVMIAEYFEVEQTSEKLLKMKDGSSVWNSEATKKQKRDAVDFRMSTRRKVLWSKIGGQGELLEGPIEFPSRWIPVVRMPGREWFEEGKRYTCGAIHFSKDAQRIYNYARSQQLERLAMAPKAPFVGYAGQFTDKKWKSLNTQNWPYLEVEPLTIAGQAAPLPQRQQATNIDPALSEEIALASDEIKATTGIFDASLGQQGNETSGRAIMARQQQGSRANADFTGNRNITIRHVGMILLDMFPRIYDEPRVARILGNDGQPDLVWLGKQAVDKDGKTYMYDLSAGKFDIVLDVGPSYATKRQESAIAMSESMAAMPIVGQVAADLVVQAQDWADSDKIAARIRRSLPSQILGKDAEQDGEQGPNGQPQQPQVPPELMQQMQELQARNQELEQGTKVEMDKLQLEKYKIDVQSATDIKVAEIRANTDMQKTHIAQIAESARSAEQAERESAQSSESGTTGGQEIAPKSEAE
jgi:hypothetical protein